MTHLTSKTLLPNQYRKYLFVALCLLTNLNLLSNGNAQEENFWHSNIGNYLNLSEANQELNRLESLDFQGEVVDVTENGTSFHQLRIGCYLNETTATKYLEIVSQQLRYPSLSKVGQASEASTSLCLGFESAIELPSAWQIIEENQAFILSITLLDYKRIIGFNGLEWQSFQSQEEIPQDWLVENDMQGTSTLTCSQQEAQKIECEFDGELVAIDLSGQILWQHTNAAIYQDGNKLHVIKILSF